MMYNVYDEHDRVIAVINDDIANHIISKNEGHWFDTDLGNRFFLENNYELKSVIPTSDTPEVYLYLYKDYSIGERKQENN